MKKTLVILAALLASLSVFANTSIKGDDPCILYIGRTVAADGVCSFDWSGVTAVVTFEGTCLSVQAEDSFKNEYNLWIDKEIGPRADKVLKLGPDVVLAENLTAGRHFAVIQKRTEGEQGLATIKGFTTDGTFLPSRSLKERRIEFIGDSYTCGYGTESLSKDEPFKPETENCNLAYAEIIGRFFDADVQLVSHSGRGVVRNYAGKSPEEVMTNKYRRSFDCSEGPEWDKDDFDPAIVVIYLGTNDFSTGKHPRLKDWCKGYGVLLRDVRRLHPGVPILCVASKADVLLGDYVRAAVEKAGMENVFWTSIQSKAHNSDSELGASHHPNYEGQRKVASLMIPYVSTITGWPMAHRVVE
ncbi:MAG: GDSL-type esterase/lipase family protein [Bacteroidales bacterium]|nr:GDSL-type esterase/lipase family protein [Bacteroidales bacterium]